MAQSYIIVDVLDTAENRSPQAYRKQFHAKITEKSFIQNAIKYVHRNFDGRWMYINSDILIPNGQVLLSRKSSNNGTAEFYSLANAMYTFNQGDYYKIIILRDEITEYHIGPPSGPDGTFRIPPQPFRGIMSEWYTRHSPRRDFAKLMNAHKDWVLQMATVLEDTDRKNTKLGDHR